MHHHKRRLARAMTLVAIAWRAFSLSLKSLGTAIIETSGVNIIW